MIIGIDVDDTVLRLVGENGICGTWLSLYNTEFNDNLKPEDITDWNIAQFCKPEGREVLYDYLNYPDIFMGAEPVEGALEAINYLKSLGHRIVYITVTNVENSKSNWLIEHKFMENMTDFACLYDKSLILCDWLLDDNFDNVNNFKGNSALLSRPWNLKYTPKVRCDNWKDFLRLIEGFQSC
jgi:5'-nucleotidase